MLIIDGTDGSASLLDISSPFLLIIDGTDDPLDIGLPLRSYTLEEFVVALVTSLFSFFKKFHNLPMNPIFLGGLLISSQGSRLIGSLLPFLTILLIIVPITGVRLSLFNIKLSLPFVVSSVIFL